MKIPRMRRITEAEKSIGLQCVARDCPDCNAVAWVADEAWASGLAYCEACFPEDAPTTERERRLVELTITAAIDCRDVDCLRAAAESNTAEGLVARLLFGGCAAEDMRRVLALLDVVRSSRDDRDIMDAVREAKEAR